MKFAYHAIEERQERRRLIKSLIPEFLWLAFQKIALKRRWPDALITARSSVHKNALISPHAVIRHSAIGENARIGAFTTLGHRCRLGGKGLISVGKFCSLAPEVLIWSENHVTDRPSTFPFEQFLKGREERYTEYHGDDVFIGNDVWIGQRAVILAGAKIGHGCVVAAGSVVPRGEYEPYSVIAGVPGRAVKKRLSEEQVNEILACPWWDEPPEKIFGELMVFLHGSVTSS
ncbi:MAG: hypothetical protein K9G62_01895 [Alphaproteobacteria bacterium]|nr:hypothetical protein [Alphaproteobacteria bacterium]